MFPKDELTSVYVLITMVCFAFDAALKDLEKLYKLLSIVEDRPSVGYFTSMELCHLWHPCKGNQLLQLVCVVTTGPVEGCTTGGRAIGKKYNSCCTMFKELPFFLHNTSSFQNQKMSGPLPDSI